MKIKSKNISVKIKENHLVVYYEDKVLFKVSNNIDNAIQLARLINHKG